MAPFWRDAQARFSVEVELGVKSRLKSLFAGGILGRLISRKVFDYAEQGFSRHGNVGRLNFSHGNAVHLFG
jgi:hypothetical protein